MNYLTINPSSFFGGYVNLPGSKSISIRVLLLAAQSIGITHIYNLLYSDDIKYTLIALKKLGVRYFLFKNNTSCTIFGLGNSFYNINKLSIFLGQSGALMRFLLAILCLGNKHIILTGSPYINHRPIEPLIHALRQGGAKFILKKDKLPIILGGFIGGKINIIGNISSQFISALLMLAPLANYNTTIIVKNKIISKPYIDMTINIMKVFGVKIINYNYKYFYIVGKQHYYSPGNYIIEGDVTHASYFLAASVISNNAVLINNINYSSIQGDIKFLNILNKMGAKILLSSNYIKCIGADKLYSINIDCKNIPDVAMTAAIISIFATGTTKLYNISTWSIKETNRIVAITNELIKLGVKVISNQNSMIIIPQKKLSKYVIINTYNDHRIAMCFALMILAKIKITIINPDCVNKSFPNFFKYFLSYCYNDNN
ncbi:MAG: 3-phosphoshikimate 1-carboxyvinyltransferase [Candidatus Lightella neohaematopini]|nr:3-phosphoshikimate 1-carboxyvinyltransferase [Candidatus Lightella neohaematopini]